MAWYDEAIFYHIYPLGLTGAPSENSYGEVTHRLNELVPWIDHIRELGCNALYIGPLFESVGHGYETTDYKKLDSRLGDNKDLAAFISKCHKKGIRVILDGVFNHTGRDFFAFLDIKKNRENSRYRDWYCNVNFYGNNEYNDGFSYDNWGGYNLLVKLNQRNPEVKDYICDVIRFWVKEFDIDGLRLDAADVLDFDFMKALRSVANEVKEDFWLMGEVIHGDYSRWVNEGTLHSVTNYVMHKALYSGHNDHNYFEIAHTQRRLEGFGASGHSRFKLYNFVDNHDVERIYTKLQNKAHFTPVHVLLYTLPGIPSIYYGSEFAIEGKKERHSDASLRPTLNLKDFASAIKDNPATKLIAALGKVRSETPELSNGDYKELLLTNRQYAFSRSYNGRSVISTVNNDDSDYTMTLPAGGAPVYIGALTGERVSVNNGNITVKVSANSGEIWIPLNEGDKAEYIKSVGAIEPINPVGQAKPANAAMQVDAAEQTKPTGSHAQATQGQAAPDMPSQAPAVTTEPAAPAQITSASPEPATPAQASPASSESATLEQMTPAQTTYASAEAQKSSPSEQKRSYEDGIIAGLQEAIIAIMEKNGPVTDRMRQDVLENTHHDSLITWVKSFR